MTNGPGPEGPQIPQPREATVNQPPPIIPTPEPAKDRAWRWLQRKALRLLNRGQTGSLQPGQETNPQSPTVQTATEQDTILDGLAQKIATEQIKPTASSTARNDENDSLPGEREWYFTTPNETSLYRLQPHLENIHGTIIATGSDQGLNLLAMCPNVDTLRVVDVSPSGTTMNFFYLETATRFTQLMGRESTPQELLDLYRNKTLTLSLLQLSPRESFQHAFTEAELGNIDSLLSGYGQFDEFTTYLEQQTTENPYFWMHKRHLSKILGKYRDGQIHVHRGSLTKGAVMDSIRESGESVGLVYLSNVVNNGYLSREDIDDLRNTMNGVSSENALFVNAITRVDTAMLGIEKTDNYRQGEGDWTYLLQDQYSFLRYARSDNPDLAVSPFVALKTPLDRDIMMEYLGQEIYSQRKALP